jgi:acyl-CoA synthetase (AMP-forming)/AMP-acid ligase II
MMNIKAVLEENSGKTAFVWREERFSYDSISTRMQFWQAKLAHINSGKIVGLESDFSPETIAILLTLIMKKNIIVPLDINNSSKNSKKIEIAELDYLITVTGEEVVKIEKVEIANAKNEMYDNLISSEIPGLVLFTSGSSGEPKGAVHNFEKLLSKFQVRRKSLLTINFLLFDHWGGLNTLFHVLSSGGSLVFLEKRNPDYVCRLIEKHKVELLPTSPTFLNMLLLSRSYERYSLSSLQIISYGSEPMPENLLQRLSTLFPEIKLQQTYGLIELGVMRSRSESNDSLWVKLGGEGYRTRVEDGILQIKSDSAMLGYLNANSPFTQDGWFITGDSVEVKGEYFRILGRKSEIINVGGEKVYPQEVENVILQIAGIGDVMVYAEANPITGKIVCAKVKYLGEKSDSEISRKIKSYCRQHLETFKVPVKVNVVDSTFESDRFKKRRVTS